MTFVLWLSDLRHIALWLLCLMSLLCYIRAFWKDKSKSTIKLGCFWCQFENESVQLHLPSWLIIPCGNFSQKIIMAYADILCVKMKLISSLPKNLKWLPQFRRVLSFSIEKFIKSIVNYVYVMQPLLALSHYYSYYRIWQRRSRKGIKKQLSKLLTW